MTPLELVARWRQQAELLRAHGAAEAAATKAHDAAELEETMRQHQLEELTPKQAAAERAVTRPRSGATSPNARRFAAKSWHA